MLSQVSPAATLPQDAGAMIPELNMKVVRFAETHKGKQVGNGECWTLAAEALASAGAQRPGADGVDVCDFGRKLGRGEAILPGDIVQFEKVQFTRKDPTGKAPPVVSAFPQHTAIVTRVEGRTLTLLHQNFGGRKTVERIVINLDDLTAGTVTFYRPRPARKSGGVPRAPSALP